MRRGTTPTVAIHVDADLTAWTLYVTFRAGQATLTVTSADDAMTVESDGDGGTNVKFKLTQAQTLGFKNGETVQVQMRAVSESGDTAIATDIGQMKFGGILLDGEISPIADEGDGADG